MIAMTDNFIPVSRTDADRLGGWRSWRSVLINGVYTDIAVNDVYNAANMSMRRNHCAAVRLIRLEGGKAPVIY